MGAGMPLTGSAVRSRLRPVAGVRFDLVAGTAERGPRGGRLETPHGGVDTPSFMPVGTRGTVRGLTPDQLRATGARLLLANAYHLGLRPGAETVRRLGGLHAFMGWDGPLLTDSGGYQVLSLAAHREVTDAGVRFRAPELGGAEVFLGPREAVAIQEALGADVAMALDDLVPSDSPRPALEAAMARTTRWAQACVDARTRPDQALFGIVQGGNDAGLRAAHARALAALPFDGFGIGGLGVGESAADRRAMCEAAIAALPAHAPRYLMGLGQPTDLVDAVEAGVDLFDCVVPTRNGRNGEVFTRAGTLKLRNARYADDARPLDPDCGCPACRDFTRGAIRHFFLANEMLGPILAALHNVAFYQDLMVALRGAVAGGDLTGPRALAARAEAPADP